METYSQMFYKILAAWLHKAQALPFFFIITYGMVDEVTETLYKKIKILNIYPFTVSITASSCLR